MATDNLEFYARMQQLEEMQHNREKQRTILEKEFNTYVKSDTRLNKIRASKLQSYWTKICEDERRSRGRNDQLLQEYERVDAHVAALSARTDRLRLLKDQYEKQIEIMYPRWQEQVEMKRRQQLLQQQKEQQQLAQRVQHLQQQQRSFGQQQQQQNLPPYQQDLQQHAEPPQLAQQVPQMSQQQRPQGQHQQQQQYLPNQHTQFLHQNHSERMPLPNQQQQQQQPLQISNLNSDYNHLQRSSPLIPNIQVQANTPPQRSLQDPLYASLQFSSRPSNLPYGVSTAGPRFLQGAPADDDYEVPSGANMPNGSLEYHQDGRGAMMYKQARPAMDNLQDNNLQHPAGDFGYTQLHAGHQSTRLPSQGTSGSSMYTDIQRSESLGAGGGGLQSGTYPQGGSQAVKSRPEAPRLTQTASATSKHELDSVDQSVGAGSTNPATQSSSGITPAPSSAYQQPRITPQPERVPRGKSSQNVNQAKQAAKRTVFNQINDSDGDNDSVVTPLNDEDLYETPATVSSSQSRLGNSQLKSAESLKPPERAGSAVSGKVISTARTDPFSSEEDEDEEEEEEDSIVEEDTAALRDALQKQLHVRGDEAAERRQTTMATDDTRRRANEDKQLKATGGGNADGKGLHHVPVADEPRQMQQPKKTSEEEDRESDSDDDEEIGSDMSLPLSDAGETGPSGRGKIPAARTRMKPPASVTSQELRAQPKASTLIVTEQGLWRLVSAVEQEIDQSDNIEKMYNLPECTSALKTEIARTVNNNGSLDHLNPNAISMVVLQQLQQIAQTLPGGCLLSDKLLDTNRAISEVTVRSFLYSSALGFWDKLLQHLVLLIRKGVMDAEDVANMVAPLLISPDSSMADKAVDVLTTILQDQEQLEDSQLDDTYSTLPSASATPSHLSMPQQDAVNQRQAPPDVPRLDLGGTGDHEAPDLETDRVSHNSFFDEPAVPLTETKAYQQMMQGSVKVKTQEAEGDSDEEDEEDGSSDDEEDDEIEKATRLSPETPPSSRNKKRRNVLSSFGGSNSLGLSYGDDNDEDEDDGDGARQDGGETKRSEISDLVSSPSPSPSPRGSAYVPSAMEQSMKSTGRSDPLQRSAAFWGEESDMEESEMTVPMGTLKSDDLKDDFDFYD